MRAASIALAVLATVTTAEAQFMADMDGGVYAEGTVRHAVVEGQSQLRVGGILIVAGDKTPAGLFAQLRAWEGQWVKLSGEEDLSRTRGVPTEDRVPEDGFAPDGLDYPWWREGTYYLQRSSLQPELLLLNERGRSRTVTGPMHDPKLATAGLHQVEVRGWKFDFHFERHRASIHKVALPRDRHARFWVHGWRLSGMTEWVDPATPEGRSTLAMVAESKPDSRILRGDVVWDVVRKDRVGGTAFLRGDTAGYYTLNGSWDVFREEELLLFHGRTIAVRGVVGSEPRSSEVSGTMWRGQILVERLESPRRDSNLQGLIVEGGGALIDTRPRFRAFNPKARTEEYAPTPAGRVGLVVAPNHPGPSSPAREHRDDMRRLLGFLAGQQVRLNGWVFLLESGKIDQALVLSVNGRYRVTQAPLVVLGLDAEGALLVKEPSGIVRHVQPKHVEFDPEQAQEQAQEIQEEEPQPLSGIKDLLPE